MVKRQNILNQYFGWLCFLVNNNVNHEGNFTFNNLLLILHKKQFRWKIHYDYNRAFEGKNLRCVFCEELGYDYESCYDIFDFECTMLELLISLAYRCCNGNIEDGPDNNMQKWFWRLIFNANLYQFNDQIDFDFSYVDDILENIIERRYGRNGSGGLFPVKKCRKDQRKIELWYQMSTYLVENYLA